MNVSVRTENLRQPYKSIVEDLVHHMLEASSRGDIEATRVLTQATTIMLSPALTESSPAPVKAPEPILDVLDRIGKQATPPPPRPEPVSFGKVDYVWGLDSDGNFRSFRPVPDGKKPLDNRILLPNIEHMVKRLAAYNGRSCDLLQLMEDFRTEPVGRRPGTNTDHSRGFLRWLHHNRVIPKCSGRKVKIPKNFEPLFRAAWSQLVVF